MKKICLLFVIFAAFVFSGFSTPVSVEKAAVIAKNVFYEGVKEFQVIDYQTIKVELFTTAKDDEHSLLYIFNINASVRGYVIIAADDDVYPVIGYSFEGIFDNNKLNPALSDWISARQNEISFILDHHLQADNLIRQEWTRLSVIPVSRGFRSISPLVTAKWGQGKYYNRNCPQDAAAPASQDGRTLVGCVAIAMGQIMKYHQSPSTGSGSHSYYHNTYGTLSANFGMTTYNWSNMPNTLSTHNSDVATLLYHCGVSVEMNYGVSGSSSYPSDAAYAFVNYFGYGSTVQKKDKNNYSTSTWEGMLKDELDNSRPMLYFGYGSSGGHAFVCDGYQGSSNNYFHFNWGWDGYLDGYFYVSSLNPGTMDFTNNQGAIMGIKPGVTSGAVISLLDEIDVTPDTLVQYQNASVWVKLANLSSADFTGDYRCAIYTTSGQFVELIDTYNNVTLKKGYYYTNGFSFNKSSINAVAGTYQIVIEYKPAGGSWKLVDKNSHTHPLTIVIKTGTSNSDIRVYKAFSVTPSPLVQGDSAEVWVDIANYSSTAFNGSFTVSLFSASTGQFVETIETKTNISMPSMTHFTNGLTFKTSEISASPGDYLIAIHFMPSGGNWYLANPGSYSNPISIKVISKTINPDPYEVNNTESDAYGFAVSFVSDSCVIKTTQANIHNATDIDYYKVTLPSGYNYEVSLRLHDSYNSGDGNSYSVDGVFAYKYGANWSAYFDDEDANTFKVNDGGTVYFKVAPYFEGNLGTYLFDIRIKRSLAGKPDLIIVNENINPASVVAGNNVTATCDVKNQGLASSGSSVVKYFLSTDNQLDGSDISMASDNVISLAKDGSYSVGQQFTIPGVTAAGNYFILFVADATQSIDESDENNNVSYKQLQVIAPKPDLTIISKSATPDTVEKGGVIAVNCTLKNTGQVESSACVIKYYLSTDKFLDGNDPELGSENILPLAVNSSTSSGENLIVPVNVAAGTYYIIIFADATQVVAELDENNNIETIQVMIKSNSGIEYSENDFQPEIYPNPSDGCFKVTGIRKGSWRVEILDIDGKIVYEGEFHQPEAFIETNIASGIYLLRLSNSAGMVIRKLLIN